jgi:DNA polymerase-4
MTASGPRRILHVDMDAFFAAVEALRHPELRGRPIAVGGSAERGVVAAASYEARRYGVRSAMSSSQARRLCPGLIFVPADHRHYGEVSARIHELFYEVTPVVEPLALDEAFLDVTGYAPARDNAKQVATTLRTRIREVTGLDASVGIATNKLLAKMASEEAKPRATAQGVRPGHGVFEIEPGTERKFLAPRPVRDLWGVGPRTAERLSTRGWTTIGDLATSREADVVSLVGATAGRHLWRLAQGLDERAVESDRRAKSIGHEETFERDLLDDEAVWAELVRLADLVAQRLRSQGVAARTVTLKIRTRDFVTRTRSVTPRTPVTTASGILDCLAPLRADIRPDEGIRLLGVSGSHFVEPALQLTLAGLDSTPGANSDPSGAPPPARRPDRVDDLAASDVADRIRERFGPHAIRPGRTIRPPER